MASDDERSQNGLGLEMEEEIDMSADIGEEALFLSKQLAEKKIPPQSLAEEWIALHQKDEGLAMAQYCMANFAPFKATKCPFTREDFTREDKVQTVLTELSTKHNKKALLGTVDEAKVKEARKALKEFVQEVASRGQRGHWYKEEAGTSLGESIVSWCLTLTIMSNRQLRLFATEIAFDLVDCLVDNAVKLRSEFDTSLDLLQEQEREKGSNKKKKGKKGRKSQRNDEDSDMDEEVNQSQKVVDGGKNLGTLIDQIKALQKHVYLPRLRDVSDPIRILASSRFIGWLHKLPSHFATRANVHLNLVSVYDSHPTVRTNILNLLCRFVREHVKGSKCLGNLESDKNLFSSHIPRFAQMINDVNPKAAAAAYELNSILFKNSLVEKSRETTERLLTGILHPSRLVRGEVGIFISILLRLRFKPDTSCKSSQADAKKADLKCAKRRAEFMLKIASAFEHKSAVKAIVDGLVDSGINFIRNITLMTDMLWAMIEDEEEQAPLMLRVIEALLLKYTDSLSLGTTSGDGYRPATPIKPAQKKNGVSDLSSTISAHLPELFGLVKEYPDLLENVVNIITHMNIKDLEPHSDLLTKEAVHMIESVKKLDSTSLKAVSDLWEYMIQGEWTPAAGLKGTFMIKIIEIYNNIGRLSKQIGKGGRGGRAGHILSEFTQLYAAASIFSQHLELGCFKTQDLLDAVSDDVTEAFVHPLRMLALRIARNLMPDSEAGEEDLIDLKAKASLACTTALESIKAELKESKNKVPEQTYLAHTQALAAIGDVIWELEASGKEELKGEDHTVTVADLIEITYDLVKKSFIYEEDADQEVKIRTELLTASVTRLAMLFTDPDSNEAKRLVTLSIGEAPNLAKIIREARSHWRKKNPGEIWKLDWRVVQGMLELIEENDADQEDTIVSDYTGHTTHCANQHTSFRDSVEGPAKILEAGIAKVFEDEDEVPSRYHLLKVLGPYANRTSQKEAAELVAALEDQCPEAYLSVVSTQDISDHIRDTIRAFRDKLQLAASSKEEKEALAKEKQAKKEAAKEARKLAREEKERSKPRAKGGKKAAAKKRKRPEAESQSDAGSDSGSEEKPKKRRGGWKSRA